ncbi:DNA-3-methyladenine glycosylase I [Carnobacterium funditum]|uniref:DNA-3-methyladenine glycosylase I n=1 Tax=Carnobacterium funditum TaxID=2752 RepID=UPI001B80BB16|nr:DNA-3-methyladenine glycosylase I [Carnobacterium funditum]
MIPLKRCDWCEGNELQLNYHDNEWGVPVYTDRLHFEFLLLESMQSGLSWNTILMKRKNFRLAFDQFDYLKIAEYNETNIAELLINEGIIRHRKKIESAINNANKFIDIQKEYGSFNYYIWSFTDHKTIMNHYKTTKEVPSQTNLSDLISKDLRKKGFKFLGPVTVYSYLQAVGIIDDHLDSCFKK